MDVEKYLSMHLTHHTQAFVNQRIRACRSVTDPRLLSVEVHIPYLDIELPEIAWKADIFAVRRALMPHKIFADDPNVEIVELEPGQSREFPASSLQMHNLETLIVPLQGNHKTHWYFERWGQIPFHLQKPIAINNFYEARAINCSSEKMQFLKITGPFGSRYYRFIAETLKKMRAKADADDIHANVMTQTKKRDHVLDVALWNYWPYSDSMPLFKKCCHLSAHFMQLQSPAPMSLRQDISLRRILQESKGDWCFVIRAGTLIKKGFYEAIDQLLRKTPDDVVVVGFLEDRGDLGWGFDSQAILVNVKAWKSLGMPAFQQSVDGPVHLAVPDRDPGPGTLARWFHPSQKEISLLPKVFGWNVVNTALRREMKLESFTDEIKKLIVNIGPERVGEGEHLQDEIDKVNEFDRNLEVGFLSENQILALTYLKEETCRDELKSQFLEKENYWEVAARSQKRSLDTLYSVSTGLKDLFVLKQHGFTDSTKIVYFDFDEARLGLKKKMMQEWDGRNLPEFLSPLIDLDPEVLRIKWEDDLFWFGGAESFARLFQIVKNFKKEYHLVNIQNSSLGFSELFRKDDGESVALRYENLFMDTTLISRLGWGEGPLVTKEFGVETLNLLYQVALARHKEIALYGKDIYQGAYAPLIGNRMSDIFF